MQIFWCVTNQWCGINQACSNFPQVHKNRWSSSESSFVDTKFLASFQDCIFSLSVRRDTAATEIISTASYEREDETRGRRETTRPRQPQGQNSTKSHTKPLARSRSRLLTKRARTRGASNFILPSVRRSNSRRRVERYLEAVCRDSGDNRGKLPAVNKSSRGKRMVVITAATIETLYSRRIDRND